MSVVFQFPGEPELQMQCSTDQRLMTQTFLQKTEERLEAVVNLDAQGAEQLIHIIIRSQSRCYCDPDIVAWKLALRFVRIEGKLKHW